MSPERRECVVGPRSRRLLREEKQSAERRHRLRQEQARRDWPELRFWCVRHGLSAIVRQVRVNDGEAARNVDSWLMRDAGGRTAVWTPWLGYLRLYEPDERIKAYDVGQVMAELELIWACDE